MYGSTSGERLGSTSPFSAQPGLHNWMPAPADRLYEGEVLAEGCEAGRCAAASCSDGGQKHQCAARQALEAPFDQGTWRLCCCHVQGVPSLLWCHMCAAYMSMLCRPDKGDLSGHTSQPCHNHSAGYLSADVSNQLHGCKTPLLPFGYIIFKKS